MKAMILAAGLGTRMHPLTLKTPKPLVQVGHQPLIAWHLQKLAACGVSDVVINVSWLADQLMAAIGDGQQFGLRIHWSVESEPLETAGGIIQALSWLDEDAFLLINGDIWTQFDYGQLAQQQLGHNLAHLVLVANPDHHPEGDFYYADHQVYAHTEQMPSHGCCLTFSGMSQLSTKLFHGLPQGKAALAPILRQAIATGRVSAQINEQYWIDVGTVERLASVNHYIQREL